jgi:hypothetical protein
LSAMISQYFIGRLSRALFSKYTARPPFCASYANSPICTSPLTRNFCMFVAELRNIPKSRKWIRFALSAFQLFSRIVVSPEAAEFVNRLHPDADF